MLVFELFCVLVCFACAFGKTERDVLECRDKINRDCLEECSIAMNPRVKKIVNKCFSQVYSKTLKEQERAYAAEGFPNYLESQCSTSVAAQEAKLFQPRSRRQAWGVEERQVWGKCVASCLLGKLDQLNGCTNGCNGPPRPMAAAAVARADMAVATVQKNEAEACKNRILAMQAFFPD